MSYPPNGYDDSTVIGASLLFEKLKTLEAKVLSADPNRFTVDPALEKELRVASDEVESEWRNRIEKILELCAQLKTHYDEKTYEILLQELKESIKLAV